MKSLLAIFSVAATLISCAPTSFKYQLSTQGNEGADKIYSNGFEVGCRQLENGLSIRIASEKTKRDEIRIWLWVRNSSDKPINIIPSNFLITGYSANEESVWRVYDPDSYLAMLQDEYDNAIIAQAIVGGISTYNAGKKTEYSTTNAGAVAYDNYGNSAYAYGVSKTKTTTYDNAAANEESARQQQMIQNNRNYYNSIINGVEKGILKSVTLFPGDEISGDIMAEYNTTYGNLFDVLLPIDNENVEFTFQATNSEQ